MEIDQFNINEKPFKYIKYMKTVKLLIFFIF